MRRKVDGYDESSIPLLNLIIGDIAVLYCQFCNFTTSKKKKQNSNSIKFEWKNLNEKFLVKVINKDSL